MGCVALFAFVGYALPRDFSASVERTVPRRCPEVLPLFSGVDGVRRWWGPMLEQAERDGHGRMEVRPKPGVPTEGVGTVLVFVAGDTTMETWTLRSLAHDRAVWDVDFAGMLTVERTLALKTAGDGCAVTWSETADIGNPMMRWFSLLSDPAVNFASALEAIP